MGGVGVHGNAVLAAVRATGVEGDRTQNVAMAVLRWARDVGYRGPRGFALVVVPGETDPVVAARRLVTEWTLAGKETGDLAAL